MSTHDVEALTDADRASVDAAIGELTDGAKRWSEMDSAARADLIAATHDAVKATAQRWTDAAMAAKRTPAGNPESEEWLSGPYAVLTALQTVEKSLRTLAGGRSPVDGLNFSDAPGGRVAIQVLPGDIQDQVLLSGFSAYVWTRPGITADDVKAKAGLGARKVGENGGVGLVLGAGNVSSIGPLDVVYELVAYNRASILKLNPTFATMLSVLEEAFAPLVKAGLFRVVNGGADVGGYLVQHERIGHVHITGSGATHDAIVWGRGADADARRAAGNPLLDKEITSELGGVSPIIVVPGKWSAADIRFQAEHVVTQRLHNCGHNCVAAQTLILSADWPQREEFLTAVREVLRELPARKPWYPGAESKMDLARSTYPDAEEHNGRLLISVDESEPALWHTEYFAPVLGHTSIEGTGIEFLRAATKFANERLDGSLGVSILIDPTDRAAMGEQFDETVAELRYGALAINAWAALNFLQPGLPWGAFPGNTIDAVGSGIGVVHNAYLIDDVERSVVVGPFRPFPRSVANGEMSLAPKPPWFLTNDAGVDVARKLTNHAGERRNWLRLPGIVASAFRP